MKTVTFEVYVFGHASIKWIVTQIVAVQLARQIWIPYIINLWDAREGVPCRGIRVC